MYDEGELTDIVVEVDHKTFSYHRHVLAAISPYFDPCSLLALQNIERS